MKKSTNQNPKSNSNSEHDSSRNTKRNSERPAKSSSSKNSQHIANPKPSPNIDETYDPNRMNTVDKFSGLDTMYGFYQIQRKHKLEATEEKDEDSEERPGRLRFLNDCIDDYLDDDPNDLFSMDAKCCLNIPSDYEPTPADPSSPSLASLLDDDEDDMSGRPFGMPYCSDLDDDEPYEMPDFSDLLDNGDEDSVESDIVAMSKNLLSDIDDAFQSNYVLTDTTIDEWLAVQREKCSPHAAETIAYECFVPMGSDRSYLVTHGKERITTLHLRQADAMAEEAAKGTPLPYVLRHKTFYGRDFHVESGALIPRPETEALIDLVKKLDLPKRPVFLDLGTGSGCIAITLALEFPQALVMATDISRKALDVAHDNNLRLEGRVFFAQTDLLEDISFTDDGPFDVIIANLPYVNPKWDWLDKYALSFEPPIALYEPRLNGLALYKRLFEDMDFARETNLVKYLVVEADPCQHAELMAMAQEFSWDVCGVDGFGIAFVNNRREANEYYARQARRKASKGSKTAKSTKQSSATPAKSKNTESSKSASTRPSKSENAQSPKSKSSKSSESKNTRSSKSKDKPTE